MNFDTCRCGAMRMRPPNTGADAMPICRTCDRTEPQSRWHVSDTRRGVWHPSNPTKDDYT